MEKGTLFACTYNTINAACYGVCVYKTRRVKVNIIIVGGSSDNSDDNGSYLLSFCFARLAQNSRQNHRQRCNEIDNKRQQQ